MNLFCHYGILRGENARKLEFADLITREYEQQGPSPCQLVILLLNNGKTNSVNKQEFAGMCRSKNVELCAIGALAAYLFQRFNVDNEAFPNLKHPKNWYTIKVFRASGKKNRRTPISENTHRNRVSKAISAAKIKTSKKTHIFRLCSGKTPAMMELHSDLRRQQGRWNNTAMDKCYSDLPLPAIRALAGFSGPGSFFLPRGTVNPPKELVELVYPALDKWIRKKMMVTFTTALRLNNSLKF
jgi:hypothetical protein